MKDCDKYGHSCETCLNYQFDKDKKSLYCCLEADVQMACKTQHFENNVYVNWKQDNLLSIGKYACLKSQEIFGKLKAKFFNVLEAQLPPEPGDRRLKAFKNITEDIINQIANDIKEAILQAEMPNKTINT